MSVSTGQVVSHSFRSHALVKEMRMQVYLPPAFSETPSSPYPLVLLLHPWGADETFWMEDLTFHLDADRLIGSGALSPFIAVCPQGDKSYFINAGDSGSNFDSIIRFDPEYYDSALEGYGYYGDYILEDVMEAVRKRFPVRVDQAGLSIGGVEMGATGASILGLTYPERFGAVGIHSPNLFERVGLGPPWIFGMSDPQVFADRNPLELAHSLKRQTAPRFYVDHGFDDQNAIVTADLHYVLVEHNIDHVYQTAPGGQDMSYWKQNISDYITFYASDW